MKKQLLLLTLSFICFTTIAQVPAYVPTGNLISWYPFNGNANDESGHANNGTVFGASLTTDRNGISNTAYHFNGVSDYISGTISDFTNTSVSTVSAWIYYTGSSADRTYNSYFQYGIYAEHTFAYSYDYTLNNLNLYSFCFDNPYYPVSLNDNWHHVVIVDSVTQIKIYTDGSLDTTFPSITTTNCYQGSSEFFIGESDGDDQHVKGKLDDMGIWDRALNSCEIYKLYTSLPSLITMAPSNDTIIAGSAAMFSISDTGGAATYQWQENGGTGFINLSDAGSYSGTTTKTLTIDPASATLNNYQYRCVRNGGACLDTSATAKLRIYATGFYTVLESDLTISPNPAKNTIIIKSSVPVYKAELINFLGQKIISKYDNATEISLDIHALNAGIYILKINDTYIQKIIKE